MVDSDILSPKMLDSTRGRRRSMDLQVFNLCYACLPFDKDPL